MSDFFKFEYIDPKNIILNKNNEDYGTIIDGTKSGININTFQQPTRLTFKSDFIGGDVQEIISIRNSPQIQEIFGPSINTIDDNGPIGNQDKIVIYETGYLNSDFFSRGPYIRLGKHNIISEKSDSKLGIGTLFPEEKVHISGGNLRVDGGASFTVRPNVNGTGILLSGEAASLPATIVYTTGNQTISGTKNFITRPQVNNIGVVISGEAYPSNNPSGYITGVNLSSYITTGQTGAFYPASNPSGFITGVDTSNFYTKDNPSGFITGVEKQTKLFDYVTGVPIYMYVGSAPFNSSQNDNVWEIYRTQIDQNGLVSSNLLAENVTWTGRYFENYM